MSIVDAARSAAARLLLLDECTITRLGDPVFDPNTGLYTRPTVQVYSGACNLTPYRGVGALAEMLGGEPLDTRNYLLSIEWDAAEVIEEDIASITASEDPLLIGRTFRVLHPEAESFQTARRLVVESIRTSQSEESSSESSS